MQDLPPEFEGDELFRRMGQEKRLKAFLARPLVLVVALAGLISLFLAFVLPPSIEVSRALRGLGFFCFGVLGSALVAYTWRHRLPFKTGGGLDPKRPFFYHLGSALLLLTSVLLALAGMSVIQTWVNS